MNGALDVETLEVDAAVCSVVVVGLATMEMIARALAGEARATSCTVTS